MQFKFFSLLIFNLICGLAYTENADVIYLGDNIITVDESNQNADAVAIKGERIIAVGKRSKVLKFKNDATKIIELGDKALLPGLIDAHGHIGFQAYLSTQVNLSSPPVGNIKTLDDLKTALTEYIQRNEIPEGQWVLGYGYDESLLKEKRHPQRHDLDQIGTKHPIYLTHVSGHLGAVNSKALELAGINADTKNPKGGVYRREQDSNIPNGVLEEKAAFGIRELFPQPGLEQSVENLIAAQNYYARYGITTIQDGAADENLLKLLSYAADQNKLFIDTVAYHFMLDPDGELPQNYSKAYNNQFRIGGVKMILDGSPQGKTAYLSEPYKVPPHGQNNLYRGYPIYQPDIATAMIDRILSAKLPLLAHANGDAAAEILIHAVAKSHEKLENKDTRVTMIHAQTVREDQLDRMAALGMIPSFFSTHTFFWGDWHRDSVLGIDRGYRISPTQSALRRNMTFTVHNDTPIVPPDMVRLLWSTTNRRTRSGDIIGPKQRISTYEALKAMTIYAARQYFEEDTKGSISVGKQADLVITSQNPLTMNKEDLLNLKIIETISRGKTVYQAQPSRL